MTSLPQSLSAPTSSRGPVSRVSEWVGIGCVLKQQYPRVAFALFLARYGDTSHLHGHESIVTCHVTFSCQQTVSLIFSIFSFPSYHNDSYLIEFIIKHKLFNLLFQFIISPVCTSNLRGHRTNTIKAVGPEGFWSCLYQITGRDNTIVSPFTFLRACAFVYSCDKSRQMFTPSRMCVHGTLRHKQEWRLCFMYIWSVLLVGSLSCV